MLFTSKKGHEITSKQSTIRTQIVICLDIIVVKNRQDLNETYNRS